MEGKLSVERLYFIENYQNIKFNSELTGVPERLMKDERAKELLFYLQALSCDIAYRRYMELRETVIKSGVKNITEFLKEEQKAAQEQLYKLIADAQNDSKKGE